MIITCKKEVPFRWIAFSALPSAVFTYSGCVMGICFLYSLKKFVENPAGLTFVMSLPGFVSIASVPVGNFISDRIWTRFGRRKPFIVTGWIGMALCLTLIPLASTFWVLLALYIIFNLFNDIGGALGPMEPLTQEIVPPHQRGRATGIGSWCGNIMSMTFYFVALGRFDDVRFMAGVPVTGEQAIYWVAALLTGVVLLYIALGIKETDQSSPLRGQRLNLRNFFAGLLDAELWPVYTLIFSSAMLNAGLGSLGSLLYTDQWGYSKQDMGTNVMIGGVINVFVIGYLSVIADKLNRMRAYQALIMIAMGLKVAYYVYVSYILPDRRPSLVEMVVFGESMSIVGILTSMVYTPLVYDYVTRNKMGTYMAGAGIVNRLTAILTVNGVGLFIWGFTVLFQPPAGDMVRVALRGEAGKNAVAEMAKKGQWTVPSEGAPLPASRLHMNAWYGTGLVADGGQCWEIRMPDRGSERLAAQEEQLAREDSPITSDEAILRERVAALKRKGNDDAALAAERKADSDKARSRDLELQIAQIKTQLDANARAFQQEVSTAFDGTMLRDGEQVLGAKTCDAIVIELPAAERPERAVMEAILAGVRKARPAVIDLRPVKRDAGYGIAVCAALTPAEDAAGAARDLQGAVERVAADRDAGLLKAGAAPLAITRERAIEIDLMLIEEPLDTHISPITRIVNRALALFGDAPAPDRRLLAMARTLRVPGETGFVRVDAAAGGAHAISVTAVLDPGASQASGENDAITHQLQALLGAGQPGTLVSQARALFDRIDNAAAAQRLTVARPFVTVQYAPRKYDYMCGYIWMFLMGIVGLSITFAFIRREKRGLIRKYGVEEALAITNGPAPAPPLDGPPPTPSLADNIPAVDYYVPGRAGRKFLMMLGGVALLLYGCTELWTPLRLLVSGARTEAEAFRVVETRQGMPDQILTDDLQIKSRTESQDRTYRFWNEFRFQTAEGRTVTVRPGIGSELKPLYPLLDEDGLPTSILVCYDPAQPSIVVFPGIFSTWFAPGALTALGLLCAVTGFFLFYWANRPIERPHMPARPESDPETGGNPLAPAH